MSFDSTTSESLNTVSFRDEHTKFNTMPNIVFLDTEKKIKRVNILMKNKKMRYYFPLGVYTVEKKNTDDY